MADENTLQTGIVGLQHRDTTIKVHVHVVLCGEAGAEVCGTCVRSCVVMMMNVTHGSAGKKNYDAL